MMMPAGASLSMNKSAAPKRKSKATSNIGGKKRLNDEMSSKLYKMSKQ